MTDDFLRCPYSFNCPNHSQPGKVFIIRDDSKKYTCRNPDYQYSDSVNDCTYLHQLANEDKQTELLEKILTELRPKRVGETNPDDFEDRDYP